MEKIAKTKAFDAPSQSKLMANCVQLKRNQQDEAAVALAYLPGLPLRSL